MGGGGSQTINQTFNLSAVNRSIFEQITKNTSESAASQANVQRLEVVLGNVKGCTVRFGQKIDGRTQSASTLTATTTTEIKNAITNELQASASAAVEKATQMGNMQFGDKQNVNQEVTLAIENVIENSITTENMNRAIADQVSIQGGKLHIQNQYNNLRDLNKKVIFQKNPIFKFYRNSKHDLTHLVSNFNTDSFRSLILTQNRINHST